MMYRKHESYADPAAGQALANIIREERAKRSQPDHTKRCKDPREVSE